ncbi:MAG: hypothetical protein QF351_06215, partial [Phycisphaerales bacterium]|nr:hypothetical protein [Phycisphaerales bacterium]
MTFHDVNADRFLNPNVRTRFDRSNHRQSVPMIRCVDQNQFRLCLRKKLSIVSKQLGLAIRLLPCGNDVTRFVQHIFVDITKSNDIDRFDLKQPKQVTLPVPATPNQCHAFGFGFLTVAQVETTGCQRGQSSCRTMQEFPAAHLIFILLEDKSQSHETMRHSDATV